MSKSALQEWLALSDVTKRNIFRETANVLDLPISAIEKDWWVVHTLSLLFEMDCASSLIFEGGTSLSKAEEFQKEPHKVRVERLSRHLYDIEKLMHSAYAEIALTNTDLYQTIVNHRSRYTAIAGIDYSKHNPGSIKFIPPIALRPDWQNDYEVMTSSMLYGERLSFQEIINRLTLLQSRINSIVH
jgi:predicted nucleotidyltransferase component of viral defense system